ncbi:hypothetical protein EK21DRAFT_104208 [Setomelanomma holmii]|uniref:J domain-containing protein n=1 Tax=Setomelanomma holmii TaxID=210430 RepID=A0A9P4H1S9_9PLEO|nr:hypothetical protein EK21DRAFT_104208 [Setomelanomma holmii]
MPTHYDMLRIAPNADEAAIKKAYRRLALTHHPDKTLHLPDDERAQRGKIFKLLNVNFTNHHGWDFSIEVLKKFKFVSQHVVPVLQQDARSEISIGLRMVRTQGALNHDFMKEVVVNIAKSPGARQTALSSMLIETHDSVVLRISLATANDEAQQGLSVSPSWQWAFDADLGYLNTLCRKVRVTHLMFWPMNPAHAFTEANNVSSQELYPIGSPMACLKAEYPDMQFVQMSSGFYCQEQSWASRKLWRLAAYGFV